MKYQGVYRTNVLEDITTYILHKRGIKDVYHYLNTTDDDINSYESLGVQPLMQALTHIAVAVSDNQSCLVVVDSDCDGFTSAALLINYLHDLFPAWVENKVDWFIHEGKQHGLSDCIDVAMNYDIVICPDSASNDYEQHKQLQDAGKSCIVLDHHEADYISENATIINNQLSNYPNKELSGVGIVWQFCRYMDDKMGNNLADNYLDLVALGNCADMMSLTSIETKHLMNKGFNQLKNPFIYGMAKKNAYSLGGEVTPIGAAFYIAPFVNAMTRSGTKDEKELLFKSMLKHFAFEEILSNKRGHKLGEMEKLVDQALRCVTNVKNRQTKAQEKGLEALEARIEANNMLEDKALIFFIEEDEKNLIDSNIRGLVANKLMAKYQRPCAILTKHFDGDDWEYAGSARGYTKSGINDFREICIGFDGTRYGQGHPNAFGLAIHDTRTKDFVNYLNISLADVGTEPIYDCDIIYQGIHVEPTDLITIAEMNNLWGQDIPEPFICIERLNITPDMVTIYNKKGFTMKITLPNGISLMKFNATEKECDFLKEDGYKTVNIIGKANKNEYMGNVNAQLFIEEYEVIGCGKHLF